ncbi:MAG: SDR family NAD(P)-dependent oxidoreductase [Cytophagales bacterium]|nr:SDR family NAD(P)-dependent oxidoreductase [Cytophagales bacterium]
MEKSKVWFVTGASRGLGLTLTKKLLEQGYRVAATSRSQAALTEGAGPASARFLPLAVDLEDEKSVRDALAATVQHFGTLDVVVNNAGYGQIGTLEELTNGEARKNFDVNVFGLLHVVRHAMPYLRAQGSGHLLNIASIGGYDGRFAGWGVYCATKFAVAGLSEGLAEEVRRFGVHVTIVYPGYFRTSFLTSDSIRTPAHPIAAYEEARASQEAHQREINGSQPGDPEKAAEVLMRVAHESVPPLHLFLGEDAFGRAHRKIESVQAELERWKTLTVSTAFPGQLV